MKSEPLSKIKSDVHKLIGTLHRQVDIMSSAGQGLNNLKSPTTYPYQSTAAQYAGVHNKGNEAEQIQAQQAIAAASAKAEKIKQELLGIGKELQRRLNVWNDNLNHLRNDPGRIKKAHSAGKHYQEAQNAAQEERCRITEILNTINAAQNSARRGMSGFSEYSRKAAAGGIDEIVGKTNIKGKFTAQNNYGLLPVTYDTVPLLDADRYGTVSYQLATEYPRPKLASAENEPSGALFDKIDQGLGFSETQRLRDYQVRLPDYLLRAFQSKYAPQDGTYSTLP